MQQQLDNLPNRQPAASSTLQLLQPLYDGCATAVTDTLCVVWCTRCCCFFSSSHCRCYCVVQVCRCRTCEQPPPGHTFCCEQQLLELPQLRQGCCMCVQQLQA